MTIKPLLVAAALSIGTPALAQLELPRPSPNAKLTQTVGLTDITVEYSSPAVRGRKIWGGLVPYGQVWRAGANGATKLTFSKDVTIGTTPVPAGSYALFVFPAATGNWTFAISKEANQPGSSAYKKEQDLLRIDVKPEIIPMHERLMFAVADFNNDQAKIELIWEKVRLALPVKLGTEAQVTANLTAMQDGAWMPYNSAARYEFEQKKDYDAGLVFVEKSLAIKEDWLNVWTKAQLLAAKGKTADAFPLAQKAQALGEKAPRFFYADDVKKALNDWKPKK